jgi:hypothetical protein
MQPGSAAAYGWCSTCTHWCRGLALARCLLPCSSAAQPPQLPPSALRGLAHLLAAPRAASTRPLAALHYTLRACGGSPNTKRIHSQRTHRGGVLRPCALNAVTGPRPSRPKRSLPACSARRRRQCAPGCRWARGAAPPRAACGGSGGEDVVRHADSGSAQTALRLARRVLLHSTPSLCNRAPAPQPRPCTHRSTRFWSSVKAL